MNYMELGYEERNLGVTACKFVVERKDTREDCIHAIEACDKVYQEALIPTNQLEALHAFEDCGFHYMESTIHLEANCEQIILPKVAQRFLKTTTYERSSQEELQTILHYIEHAGAFSTNKFALNPAFGVEVAGYRYRCWMEELLREDGMCYSIKMDGVLYGFEFVTNRDGVVELLLGSAFVEKGSGLALVTLTPSYHYWKQAKIKKVITNVSSNNLNMLRLHEMYGLRVIDMSYVLSKVKKQE